MWCFKKTPNIYKTLNQHCLISVRVAETKASLTMKWSKWNWNLQRCEIFLFQVEQNLCFFMAKYVQTEE